MNVLLYKAGRTFETDDKILSAMPLNVICKHLNGFSHNGHINCVESHGDTTRRPTSSILLGSSLANNATNMGNL